MFVTSLMHKNKVMPCFFVNTDSADIHTEIKCHAVGWCLWRNEAIVGFNPGSLQSNSVCFVCCRFPPNKVCLAPWTHLRRVQIHRWWWGPECISLPKARSTQTLLYNNGWGSIRENSLWNFRLTAAECATLKVKVRGWLSATTQESSSSVSFKL